MFKGIRVFHLLVIGFVPILVSCSSSDKDKKDESPSTLSQDPCQAFSFARTKIANGETCSVGSGESPLVRLILNSFDGAAVCTGTVIDSHTVLTAGHCFEGGVLSVDIETTAGTFTTSNYQVAPTYNGSGDIGTDDVAVVKTNESIPIAPVSLLLSENPTVGEEGFIGGYGEFAPGSIDSNPRAGKVVVAGLTDFEVVVRFQGEQSHPCQGDSGGPLIVVRNGQKAIVGVVSQSDPSVNVDNICQKGDITLYTGLRAPNVLNFIRAQAPNAGAL